MLTPEQLKEVLTSTEADRIERTRSTTNTTKFREAICAFSNDMAEHGKPGYLLIGVEDDGSLSPNGVITDDVQKQFAAYRDDGHILPQPMMAVFKQAHPDGGEFLVVEVQPSEIPPVRFDGRVHIRVGPRRATASEAEERRLSERRSVHYRTFDAAPCLGATLDDLDLDAFQNTYRREAVDPEVIRENGRTVEEQLAALRFYNPIKGCPTNAGVILFGKEPLNFFSGAYVQFTRFDGLQMEDGPVEEKQFSGALMVVLRELDMFIKSRFTQKPVKETALRERLIWDYPEAAVREIMMNAVLHRDYQFNRPTSLYFFSDRIEIQNPGGLYGLAQENFPGLNDYRNPILAEAMKPLGYVNRYGYGIRLAQRSMEQNGSPPIEFTPAQHHFLAVIRKHPQR
jgi:ATP-dependent DNA helicase RecG